MRRESHHCQMEGIEKPMAGKHLLQLNPRNIRELRTVQCTPPSHPKTMLKFVPETPHYGCCSATVRKKSRVIFHTDDAPQENMQPRGNKLQTTLSDSFRRIKFPLPQKKVSASQTEELHVENPGPPSYRCRDRKKNSQWVRGI